MCPNFESGSLTLKSERVQVTGLKSLFSLNQYCSFLLPDFKLLSGNSENGSISGAGMEECIEEVCNEGHTGRKVAGLNIAGDDQALDGFFTKSAHPYF